MATNTTNYSFKKPDESEFYNIQDQNGNWDKADAALKELDNPAFEDYTGSTPVPDAATALGNMKSKSKLSTMFSNVKAFCKGAVTLGMIVNNCVTNRSDLPGSAAQLKVLMDLHTKLNSDLKNRSADAIYQISDIAGVSTHPEYIDVGFHNVIKYSNGTRIYSAQIYVYTGAIVDSIVGYINPDFMQISRDLYGYAVDVKTDRIFLVQILPNGTVMLKTLGGQAISEQALYIRGSVQY